MKLIKNTILFTIVCLIQFGNIQAQNYYSKVFFKQGSSLLASSATGTYDNSYIITGNLDGKNLLFKIDSDANLQWSFEFGVNYDVTGQVTELRDSTYLLATDYFDEELNYSVLSCLNFDGNGDTIWSTTTSLGNYVDVFCVEQTADDGTIIGAKLRHTPSPPYHNIAIIKLDEVGNLDWARTYTAGTHSDDVFSIKQLSGEGYIVTGTINNRDPYTSKAFLLKLDNDGQLLWSKSYQSPELDNSNGYEVLVEDDGFLLSMYSNWKTHLLKTDIEGEVIWAKYYNTWGEEGMYGPSKKRIFKSSDTSYVIFVPDFLFEINNSGEPLWSTYYFTYLTDVAKSNDGGFLVVGNGPIIGVNKIPYDPQVGVIKTDMYGQTDGLCSGPDGVFYDSTTIISSPVSFTSEVLGMQVYYQVDVAMASVNYEDNSCVAFIGSTDENMGKFEFEVFPNPSNGIFQVRSEIGTIASSFRLINSVGEEIVNEKRMSSNWTVDLSNRQRGTYYLQIITDDAIEFHKLVLIK